MAVQPCYNGGNPADDEGRRIAIWRWAKENAIDKGMPYQKVRDEINEHFFQGRARSEWIHDILSGRKTPFRQVADDLWKTQYNRRVIVQQAKDLSRLAGMSPVQRALHEALGIPRDISLFGHSVAYPVTHGIDLAFNPSRWGVYFRNFFDTYRGQIDPALVARRVAETESRPLFTTALRGGLDVGPKSHPVGIVGRFGALRNQRSWDMLKVLRYQLWESQMQKFVKPGMSKEDVLDMSSHFADWANHATGSSKVALPGGGTVWFGPKLTVSKFARLFADPVKTANTYAKMLLGEKTTPGERAVARIRLVGLANYVAGYLGFTAVNWGINKAMGVQDKDNVNFSDPLRPDFLKFKIGGLQIGAPGLHTEIKTLAQVLALSPLAPVIGRKQLPDKKLKELYGKTPQEAITEALSMYGWAKTAPGIQVAKELLLGHDWRGKPLPYPWVPSSPKQVSWGEYLMSKAPIPATGPLAYVYDKFKQGGMSAMDAETITKALLMFGIGYTGLHVKEDKTPPPPPPSSTHARASHRR